MTEDGNLNFLIDIDIKGLRESAEEAKAAFDKLGKHAESTGVEIDRMFSSLGQNTDFDISTIEGKMDALREVVSQNQQTLRNWSNEVKSLEQAANQAFGKGDFGLFNAINDDIVSRQKEIADLTAETAAYEQVLQHLKETTSTFQGGTTATRFFTTEEDYQQVKQLESSIEELKDKLAQTTDDTEFTQINGQIIELQGQLDTANAKAEAAATLLGEKMGAAAAEASASVYELNAAVAEAQETYDNLTKQLESVAEALKEATEAGDTEEVKRLQLQYQDLTEQVSNAGAALSGLKGRQKDAAASWDSLTKSVKNNTKPLGQSITSVRQLSAAFSNTSNPLAMFRAALMALRGGMNLSQVSVKGLITSIRALGAAIIANPIGLIVTAFIALAAVRIRTE